MLGCYIYEAHFECHDILTLGKSPIKWRQRPNMTIAVDWDLKHQFKHTNKSIIYIYFVYLEPFCLCVVVYFVFKSDLHPNQGYFSSCEMGQLEGGVKTRAPREKPP